MLNFVNVHKYILIVNGRMLPKIRVLFLMDPRLIKQSFFMTLMVVVLVYLLHPGRFASWYPFIKISDITAELEPSPYVRGTKNKPLCSLISDHLSDKLLYPNESVSEHDLREIANRLKVTAGGSWEPTTCTSQHQVAIIIPFRNRTAHLNIFLAYMHPFLQQQQLMYRIFIVEQTGKRSFNRAKLFNIGYTQAMKFLPYHCFIFHDVDLIPQKLSNIYACTRQPRHMSSSVNTFRYNLPYRELFGGAVAILQKQFEFVNGFSNVFFGWGGEDDDFQGRISNKGMKMCRFEPTVARYVMLPHAKELPSEDRFVNLGSGRERFEIDGLNTQKYSLVRITHEPLHTHLWVEV